MIPRRPRPFAAFDVLILIGFATAGAVVATWHVRNIQRVMPGYYGPFRDAGGWRGVLHDQSVRIERWLGPFLVFAIVGAGTAPLRRRGLLRGREWPGPGIVAGTLGTLLVLYMLANVILLHWSSTTWA